MEFCFVFLGSQSFFWVGCSNNWPKFQGRNNCYQMRSRSLSQIPTGASKGQTFHSQLRLRNRPDDLQPPASLSGSPGKPSFPNLAVRWPICPTSNLRVCNYKNNICINIFNVKCTKNNCRGGRHGTWRQRRKRGHRQCRYVINKNLNNDEHNDDHDDEMMMATMLMVAMTMVRS